MSYKNKRYTIWEFLLCTSSRTRTQTHILIIVYTVLYCICIYCAVLYMYCIVLYCSCAQGKASTRISISSNPSRVSTRLAGAACARGCSRNRRRGRGDGSGACRSNGRRGRLRRRRRLRGIVAHRCHMVLERFQKRSRPLRQIRDLAAIHSDRLHLRRTHMQLQVR